MFSAIIVLHLHLMVTVGHVTDQHLMGAAFLMKCVLQNPTYRPYRKALTISVVLNVIPEHV